MKTSNAWNSYSPMQLAELEVFATDYKHFLSSCKTERECVDYCEAIARNAGYVDLFSCETLKPGDRVYVRWMNKCFVMFMIGSEPIEKGMRILGAHIDSPRLDVKQNPLYEEKDLAYFDTHYYGGIKKYQWVTTPLAIHGVLCKKDGTTVTVNIGEKDTDPVFCISDLLIHLSGKQLEKNAAKVIEGEQLDVIIGSRPLKDEDEPVRARILQILKSEYAVDEEDFLSAELEIVPAGPARDLGFDRSMILGYGHDDRVCSYPSFRSVLDQKEIPQKTLCCVLTDKEEIGSVGATGLESRYFENIVAELCCRCSNYSDMTLRRALQNSEMLSNDVSAGYDPAFTDAFESKNAAFIGHGVCFNKYVGARGKSGSNDTNAEYMAWLRRIMDNAGVQFQTAEIGRVDAGGGGTIAYMCAKYGMNIIDCGVAVLSMHAPWEIISKADLYEAYKAYVAFLND